MNETNYIKLEFPSKSCNEAFARTAAAAFAAQLDKLPTWVEVCRQRAEAEARERASRGRRE